MNKQPFPHLWIFNTLPPAHQQVFHLFAVYPHKLCFSRTGTEPTLREDHYALHLHPFKAHAASCMLLYSHVLYFISYSSVFYLSFREPLNRSSSRLSLCTCLITIWLIFLPSLLIQHNPSSHVSLLWYHALSSTSPHFSHLYCVSFISIMLYFCCLISSLPRLHLSSALLFMHLSAVFCETHIQAGCRISPSLSLPFLLCCMLLVLIFHARPCPCLDFLFS